jgi:hypothetical protein
MNSRNHNIYKRCRLSSPSWRCRFLLTTLSVLSIDVS